jgi:DNA-binding GntR family transcriptional regulator
MNNRHPLDREILRRMDAFWRAHPNHRFNWRLLAHDLGVSEDDVGYAIERLQRDGLARFREGGLAELTSYGMAVAEDDE